MTRASAIVVGAGIGGLTAALALARGGWSVTVLERRTGFSEIGAGLQLSPNAGRVLSSLGLGPAVARIACEPARVVVRTARTGAALGEVALGTFMRERHGTPYLVAHRADLQTVLLDAVRGTPGIRLLMGRKVEGVREEPTGIVATAERSGGAREDVAGDFAVGADGVWSRVRVALGDARAPVFRGYVAWRATLPRGAAPPALAGMETGLWLSPRGHVVHYPVAGGRLVNIVAVLRARDPVDGWAAPGDRNVLLAAFAGAHPDLKALVAAPETWLCRSLFDLPVARMSAGRVALLGDAAHPVLPFLAQGAALAMEDAAALVAALSRAADIPSALATYEAARRPRAARVQREARRNGRVYHASGVIALARNLVMRHLGGEGMSARYDWLYGTASVEGERTLTRL